MNNSEKPAHPITIDHIDGRDYKGLTKREYFAGLAMQSMVAGTGAQMVADKDGRYNGNNFATVVALNAIEFADELLKQLEL